MKAIIFMLLIGLGGCAQYSAFNSAVRTHGAEVADSTRETAQFTLCNAITIGAWVREFGRDKDRARAWETLCHDTKTQIPMEQK